MDEDAVRRDKNRQIIDEHQRQVREPLQDAPQTAQTQAFMRFVARENGCSVEEVASWQTPSSPPPAPRDAYVSSNAPGPVTGFNEDTDGA